LIVIKLPDLVFGAGAATRFLPIIAKFLLLGKWARKAAAFMALNTSANFSELAN
jgi:hypothetical protein